MARRLIADLLTAWERQQQTEIARLLVSEVVTNAARHALSGRPLDILVTADADRLRVTVGDDSPRWPVMRPARPDDESGRGMHLVQALASQWGVLGAARPPGGGKRVWFEIGGRGDGTLAPPRRLQYQ
jgi:anti-sigma regulatory factor (Ser/Thr protein kinase)